MKTKHIPYLVALASLFLAGETLADGNHEGQYVRESVEVSDLMVFPDGPASAGATILIRDFDNRVVNATITGDGFDPSSVYSIWVVVFNNPEYCSDPCDIDDLPGPNPDADPAVRPSVFWGGGFTTDLSGHAYVALRLVPGRTDRELFAGTQDYGIENLDKAHIHLVLRNHGPATPGLVANQVGTANEACLRPGGMCINQFFSVHQPAMEE